MNESDNFAYVGGELELFARARNWKRYWTSCIRPYLSGSVLEVGAGIGANTVLLRSSAQSGWLCLEPDLRLLGNLEFTLKQHGISGECEAVAGTLTELDPMRKFDVILYIDVLEHIPDDAAEMARAAARLNAGGRIIVLSPAHQWLFSKFDASIGHCRRYTKRTLFAAAPGTLHLERALYLDAVGLCASLANRLLLRQELPSVKQILFWDRAMVPISRWIDRLLLFTFGKSILGVWRSTVST